MLPRFAAFLLVLFTFGLLALPRPAVAFDLADVPSPRPFGWVSDRPGRVAPEVVDAIDAIGNRVQAEGRGEVAAVVVLNLDGAEPRAFATALFNRWGIGGAQRDNGILVFIALDDRAVEIILGDGIDTSQNVRHAQAIVDDVMIPRLRQRETGEALLEGVRASATRILGMRTLDPSAGSNATPIPAPPAVPERAPQLETLPPVEPDTPAPLPPAVVLPPQAVPPAPGSITVPQGLPQPIPPTTQRMPRGVTYATLLPMLAIPALALGGVGVAVALLVRRANRPPSCPLCGQPMEQLSEVQEDEFLTEGQKLEERLGSVDHLVWYCERDNHIEQTAKNAWFSRYAACPSCHHRTVADSSTMLRAATYESTGLMRHDEKCGHCGYTNSTTRILPQKTRPEARAIGNAIGMHQAMTRSDSRRSSGGSRSTLSHPRPSGGRSAGGGFGGGRSSGRGGGGKW